MENCRIARELGEVEKSVGEVRYGRELFPFVMLLVCALLFGEQWMANRFYQWNPVARVPITQEGGQRHDLLSFEPLLGKWWLVIAVAVILLAGLWIKPQFASASPLRTRILVVLRLYAHFAGHLRDVAPWCGMESI